MDLRLEHIGIAVKSLDDAVATYAKLFNIPEEDIRREENPDQKVKIAFVELANCSIELVEPMDDDSQMAKSLAARGEGMHHLCVVAAQDLEPESKRLESESFRIVSRDGDNLFFVHPKDCKGSLIEFYSQDYAQRAH